MIPKKSKSKCVSALPKILNEPTLLTWWSAMSSIIFVPFRLLGNTHLFNWLFRWPVGVDMWCRSCRPEVRIRRCVREKIRQILNLLTTFEVRTLSNSNANFVTSLLYRKERSSSANRNETVTTMGHALSDRHISWHHIKQHVNGGTTTHCHCSTKRTRLERRV